MNKLDDIPQWAWDEAENHRLPWIDGGKPIKEYVARAIIKARQDALEEAASHLEAVAINMDDELRSYVAGGGKGNATSYGGVVKYAAEQVRSLSQPQKAEQK